jgi:hypothetical protein
MIRFLLEAAKGYWLRPWASPYLRWRIETYSGLPAESITKPDFLGYVWTNRADLWRFLHWQERMKRAAR